MDEKTKKIIQERFNALPESIQEVILSSNYEETLIEIGKQYNLNVEQLGILERETTLVMMGLTPTKDFENELTRELGIDREKGFQITNDINEKIFLKIRELLKLMNTPAGEEPNLEEDKPDELFLGNPLRATIEEENTSHDTEEQKIKNTEVLKSHGIEIIPEATKNFTPSLIKEGVGGGNSMQSLPNPIPVPEKLELKGSVIPPSPSQGEGSGVRSIHPMMAQKMSMPVQAPVVKTEHTLNNLTPTSQPNVAPKTDKPKVDPYREIPE
jgi:hypothetical protein